MLSKSRLFMCAWKFGVQILDRVWKLTYQWKQACLLASTVMILKMISISDFLSDHNTFLAPKGYREVRIKWTGGKGGNQEMRIYFAIVFFLQHNFHWAGINGCKYWDCFYIYHIVLLIVLLRLLLLLPTLLSLPLSLYSPYIR